MCKKIHRGGNAEQYHADKKYKEAVAVAVEKCAADTKGHRRTLIAGNNLSAALRNLRRFEEAKRLLRKILPIARRVIGKDDALTLAMRKLYAEALCQDDRATLDDVREAATTLEDTERIARRVLGGTHPTTTAHEESLRAARAALRARETPLGSQ